MFPLPRIIYAMSRDGLLFSFLAHVSKRKTPIIATMAAGVLSGKSGTLVEKSETSADVVIDTILLFTLQTDLSRSGACYELLMFVVVLLPW